MTDEEWETVGTVLGVLWLLYSLAHGWWWITGL